MDKKFEEKYLNNFKSFLSNAKFASTYKLVFLKSIMDLADYENNPKNVIGYKWLKKENGLLKVDLNFIAIRYTKFYWDMYYKFRLKQSQALLDVNIHQFFKKDGILLKPPTISKIASDEYSKLRKNVIERSIRPQVLRRLISGINFYKRPLNKPYIEFNSEVIEFLNIYRAILVAAINYELTRYLEKINFSPRIAEKVQGKIPRDYLNPKERAYLMKFHKECFYCKKTFEDYDIDHFIPFDYLFHTDVFNCVPACEACNHTKSNKLSVREFLEEIIERNENLDTPKEYSRVWYEKLYEKCEAEYHRDREYFKP